MLPEHAVNLSRFIAPTIKEIENSRKRTGFIAGTCANEPLARTVCHLLPCFDSLPLLLLCRYPLLGQDFLLGFPAVA